MPDTLWIALWAKCLYGGMQRAITVEKSEPDLERCAVDCEWSVSPPVESSRTNYRVDIYVHYQGGAP